MKIGVFLARMQPMHNGHLAMIKRILEECDGALIILGSADKLDGRNPIPISYRKQLLEEVLANDPDIQHSANIGINCQIITLSDLTEEHDNSHDWGFYLYNNIVKIIGHHYFTLYYSDGWEIITQWFPPFVLQNSIDLKLIARNNCEDGISATVIRDFIRNDSEELQKHVPEIVYNNRHILKAFIDVWR